MIDPFFSVSWNLPSSEVIQRLRAIVFPDARSVLDVTVGAGRFWPADGCAGLVTMDLNPARRPAVIGDFQALPFKPKSVDLIAFDPPYQTDMGRGKPSVMGGRFATFSTIDWLRAAVYKGCWQAKLTARLGLIIKVQDYIHASQRVEMSQWVRTALGVPYDLHHAARASKIRDTKWTEQLSVWSNHTTYLCYRFDGKKHKRRQRADE